MKTAYITVDQNHNSRLRAYLAETAWQRMRGLFALHELTADEALLIKSCNMIHTFGMKYKIDVIFLDAANAVLKIYTHVTPGRFCVSFRATSTLELQAGIVDKQRIMLGSYLKLVNV